MTVATLSITDGPYAGNDVTTAFAYNFKIDEASEIDVYETDNLGVVTLLTLTTEYTVSGLGNPSGGNVTRVAGALPTGYTWNIRAAYTATQATAFASQGGFFPDVHEYAFDKLSYIAQQHEDLIGRSIRQHETEDVLDMRLPSAADRANQSLVFDASGNLITLPTQTGTDLVSVMGVLAAPSGSSLVGHLPSGTGGVATTVDAKLNKIVTNGDHNTLSQSVSEGGSKPLTIYNPVTVYRDAFIEGVTVDGNVVGASTFMRAYTDLTKFYSTTTGGYTSYDTLAKIGSGTSDPHYNHSYGYEARHQFRGDNGIDNFVGFFSGLTVNGSAGGGVAAATNALGFNCADALGTGTIYAQSAFYCNDLTRGTFNYGLRLGVTAGTNKYNVYAIGTADNYFLGDVIIDGSLNFNGGGTWGSGTKINMSGNSGFHFDVNTNINFTGAGTLPAINSMNDASSVYQPLQLNASIVTFPQGVTRRKIYTVGTLPSAATSGTGAESFVSDATSTTFASVAAGGGANRVPVYSDGTSWRIG